MNEPSLSEKHEKLIDKIYSKIILLNLFKSLVKGDDVGNFSKITKFVTVISKVYVMLTINPMRTLILFIPHPRNIIERIDSTGIANGFE